MRHALALAQRGRGAVEPNPLVGAVVVSDGRIVGEGWHAGYGGPHAEVVALRDAGDAAAGATLFVTLEPCAHQGKTPPCTDAIIAAGVAEVVFASSDPNPVAGGGANALRAAGVRVTADVERDAARALNAMFFHTHEHGSPWFTLKLAVSVDGRIAGSAGQRTAITGPAARVETHRMRAAHDAVLIGIGTALIDDPLLTVRDAPARVQPARIILDRQARLPLSSRLVQSVGDGRVMVICGDAAPASRTAALERAGVSVLRTAADADGIRPGALVDAIGQVGIGSLFVEGGSRVAGTLLEAGLIRRLHLFVAPIWLGTGGVPAFALDTPIRAGWLHSSTSRFDPDVLLTLDRAEAA
ncbi:bifunctional diaminohydroxyphosphoribosylaminopyrimidine deaminase/5-amino-6-(5-phosphoribosylamino)uracil reductase RibD [soil metagenome]